MSGDVEMPAHTPVPWRVFEKNWGFQVVTDDVPAEVIAILEWEPRTKTSGSDARLIVHRVNTYDDLLEAAQAIHAALLGDDRQHQEHSLYTDVDRALDLLEAALDKAEGRA